MGIGDSIVLKMYGTITSNLVTYGTYKIDGSEVDLVFRDAVQITYAFWPSYFALTAPKNNFRNWGYAKDF